MTRDSYFYYCEWSCGHLRRQTTSRDSNLLGAYKKKEKDYYTLKSIGEGCYKITEININSCY